MLPGPAAEMSVLGGCVGPAGLETALGMDGGVGLTYVRTGEQEEGLGGGWEMVTTKS